MRLAVVLVIVVLVTLPFGFYRAYTRKFSVRWFLAIHLPIPLVFLVRFGADLSYVFIPFTCAAFCFGQLAGGMAARRWMARRGPMGEPPPEQGGVPGAGMG